MATLTRAELAQRIMHNPFFRELLELVPQVGVRLGGGVWAGFAMMAPVVLQPCMCSDCPYSVVLCRVCVCAGCVGSVCVGSYRLCQCVFLGPLRVPSRSLTHTHTPACTRADMYTHSQVREAVSDFYASKYTSCLNHLDSLR